MFDEKYLHIHRFWKQQQGVISTPCTASNRQENKYGDTAVGLLVLKAHKHRIKKKHFLSELKLVNTI